jgi:Putative auto-transporter adhesin, head GIN domain
MYGRRLIFLLTVSCVCLISCRHFIRGEGNKTTDIRQGQPFKYVDVSVPIQLNVTVNGGGTNEVVLAGYDNLLKHILTRSDHDTLVIELDKGYTMIEGQGTTATIQMSRLAGLSLEGAPSVTVHGNVTGDELAVNVSGAGNINMEALNVKRFSFGVSGEANISVDSGNVQSAAYGISGAARVHAYHLLCEDVTVDISGAGSAEVNAATSLTAGISGAGHISYRGHPRITQNISGAGSLVDNN